MPTPTAFFLATWLPGRRATCIGTHRPVWALPLLCAALWSPAQAVLAQDAPTAAAAPAASAQAPRVGDAARMQQALERGLSELSVSEEQRSRISALAREAAAGKQKRAERGAALRQQGRSLMTAAQPDQAALERWHKEVSAHAEQARRERVSSFMAIRQVLTPEQRAKWDAQREARAKARAAHKATHKAQARQRWHSGAGSSGKTAAPHQPVEAR